MHVLVTGGTGFIGAALLPALADRGHSMTILTRQTLADRDSIHYVQRLDDVSGPVDAVINLAGASLAGKRWNAAYKAELVASRLDTTKALGDYFRGRGEVPGVWLNASAIGYYGAHGDERLDESAEVGSGFAAELCRDWEAAARDAAPTGTRLCLLRLGVVLDRSGGAYLQMATPFRMGIANWIGDGRQYMSWIHRADVVAAMAFLLDREDMDGVVNLTAPEPVTSREFCAAMKKVHRPLLTAPVPAPIMRLMVGEMADELLISGQRVVPKRLLDAGFSFASASIDDALATIEG